MTPERWERVKDLFERALDLPAAGREQFLRDCCSDDVEMFEQVRELLERHLAAGQFLDPGALRFARTLSDDSSVPSLFPHGRVISGRFRVIAAIGKGGMGEVYEAEDLVFGGRVALKTIRAGLHSDSDARARFLQEIHLSRLVTHENVCRVYDVEQDSDVSDSSLICLSMELLAGETLAERLRRDGRMSSEEAMPIVRQLAAALEAAHKAGIIHRDLKPGNIMLVPRPDGSSRAVVMDFGLARPLQPDPGVAAGLTGSGVIAGTLAYMAPEQLERGPLTPATDIYALGIVLHEMVTGVKPFEGDSLAAAFRRVRQRPPSPRLLVPLLSRRWTQAILRCLHPDPSRRFRSPSELVRFLEGRMVPPRPPLVVTIAIILISLLASVFVFSRLMNQEAVTSGFSTMLLSGVKNGTGDSQLDGATMVLRSQLAQSAHFEVLAEERVPQILEQMQRKPGQALDASTTREVALRGGARTVVSGNLTRPGSQYVLNMQVEALGNGPAVARKAWNRMFAASNKRELLTALHDAGVWIRGVAGEEPKAIAFQDRPPEDTTTPSWEALRLYQQALQKQAAGDYETAIVFLREAIEIDPDFAMAHRTLADILVRLRRYADGYAQWKEAIEVVQKRHLTNRESLNIKGAYAEDIRNYDLARKINEEYAAHYPQDFSALFYLATDLELLGRYPEAIQKFAEAGQLRRGSPAAAVHRAMMYLDLGRFPEFEQERAQLRGKEWSEWSQILKSQERFLHDDLAGALASLDSPRVSPKLSSRRACLLAEMGRYREAIAVLEQGIADDQPTGNTAAQAEKYVLLAYLRYRRQERDACRAACLQALDREISPAIAVRAGTLLARAGFIDEARHLHSQMASWPEVTVFRMAQLRVRGEIALAQGHTPAALQDLRAAASLAPPAFQREYLARALVRFGNRAEAASLYRQIVERPCWLMHSPEREFPGLRADALFECARLTNQVPGSSPHILLDRFLSMRKGADPGLRDVVNQP